MSRCEEIPALREQHTQVLLRFGVACNGLQWLKHVCSACTRAACQTL